MGREYSKFVEELLEYLSIESKLPELLEKLKNLFSREFGSKNFFFLDDEKIVYGEGGSKILDYVLNLSKSSFNDFEYKDTECYMRFDSGYFLYFDLNAFTSKSELLIVYLVLKNFLRNHSKFESIYVRFKYLKSLVFSIEPLIYEVSIKNALSQSLISLTTFTEIEKALLAVISGKSIELVSKLNIEKEVLEIPEVFKHLNIVIDSKKEQFFRLKEDNNGKFVLAGILPLGDFNETRGILLVVFNEKKKEVSEIDREILKILSFVMTHRIKLHDMNVSLLKAKRKAEELSRLKSEFVANVSHELRTPLNAILGFIELLKIGEFSDEDRSRYLEYIQSASTSLLGMINNILDLSKIEAGMMKPIVTEFKLEDLLDDIKRYGEILAKNKGIDFSIINGSVENLTFRTDYTMLKSILVNLISNAIKFTEKGWVKVFVYRKSDNIIFKVEDTGIGIKESDIKKIFAPFTQLENVRNKRFSGTGIGLSLSKKFAEMINARIVPRTKGVGKGCIFYLIIPV
ncbi:MAG: sensor histidine kinase [Brevinematia bacterium]